MKTATMLKIVAATILLLSATLLAAVHLFHRAEVNNLVSHAEDRGVNYERTIHNPVLYTYSFLPE
ncbi:hypothetical protein [Corynebacterium phoceense]|uniref:hypothetical protein n=1 Tax=Corynebacterium phoceense TaxID=1686286 RepID=UPI001D6CDF9D|nr:hypothetical protein [Corynebacterium phoceense]HJG43209.1 hypothetical protein [Corynebacterium phoceense]